MTPGFVCWHSLPCFTGVVPIIEPLRLLLDAVKIANRHGTGPLRRFIVTVLPLATDVPPTGDWLATQAPV